MTTFPGSPKTARGMIVSVDVMTGRNTTITFQYNPATITRSFEIGGGASGPEAGQLARPPAESLRVELELDATDELERGEAPTVAARIAAIEMLVTPSTVATIANLALAVAGTVEILPPDGPLTLFVYGPARLQPVMVKELSVTEEAHDAQLSPTRARVTLGMRVLSWTDVGPLHPAFGLAIAAGVAREAAARRVS